MKITLDGTEYTCKDGDILRIKQGLKCSTKEACRIWLEDEGKLQNAEQNTLDAKAKKVKIDHGAVSAEVIERKFTPRPKSDKPKTAKANPTKEKIIADIAELLNGFCENVQVTNKAKIIEFSMGGNDFKIDLTQKRKPKA